MEINAGVNLYLKMSIVGAVGLNFWQCLFSFCVIPYCTLQCTGL